MTTISSQGEEMVTIELTQVKIKKLYPDAILPTRGSSAAAGWDLYAHNYNGFTDKDWTLIINPGETIKIGTGIALALPDWSFGGIYPRSGLATKQGLAPANKVGVVDADYRGEVIVALHNHSGVPQTLHRGDRIAQLIIQPYINTELTEVDELDETDRGAGGFGSSDK